MALQMCPLLELFPAVWNVFDGSVLMNFSAPHIIWIIKFLNELSPPQIIVVY